MLNVCMVGHGMMGIWHSEAMRNLDECQLHTVVGRPKAPETGSSGSTASVGRKPASTEQFAAKYGYKKWTTDFTEAVSDPEVDIVIIAGPSEAGVYTLGLTPRQDAEAAGPGSNDAANDATDARLDTALTRLHASENVVFSEAAVARPAQQ